MTTYNHMYVIAFSVVTDNEDSEVTETELRTGLLQRIIDLDRNHEWHEAVGPAEDTYEEEQ